MATSPTANAARYEYVVVAEGSTWPQGEAFVLDRDVADRRIGGPKRPDQVVVIFGARTKTEAEDAADRINGAQIEVAEKDGTVVHKGPVMPWLREAASRPYYLNFVDLGRVYGVALGQLERTPAMGNQKVVVRPIGAANRPNPNRSSRRTSLVTPWR